MNFTIASFDINEIGRGRCSSITCKVKGYWSSDTIRIYVQRGFAFEGNDWKVSVSYGSGGRDTKEVVSDTEAARYFAQALVAMCDLADSIMEQKDVLEAAYEQQHLEYKAQFEAEMAAKQAKFDADEELGMTCARNILETMITKGHCRVNLFARGEDRPKELYSTRRSNVTFFLNGNRTSKLEVLKALEQASIRTCVVA